MRVITGCFLASSTCKHLSLPRRASLLVFRGLNGDFRDWADIRQWAQGIAQQLALAPP
jgi:hypothetical protein